MNLASSHENPWQWHPQSRNPRTMTSPKWWHSMTTIPKCGTSVRRSHSRIQVKASDDLQRYKDILWQSQGIHPLTSKSQDITQNFQVRNTPCNPPTLGAIKWCGQPFSFLCQTHTGGGWTDCWIIAGHTCCLCSANKTDGWTDLFRPNQHRALDVGRWRGRGGVWTDRCLVRPTHLQPLLDQQLGRGWRDMF